MGEDELQMTRDPGAIFLLEVDGEWIPIMAAKKKTFSCLRAVCQGALNGGLQAGALLGRSRNSTVQDLRVGEAERPASLLITDLSVLVDKVSMLLVHGSDVDHDLHVPG